MNDLKLADPGSRVKPWDEAVEFVRRSTHALLVCHVSPDGDAIGSLLGLGLALRGLDKQVTLACESSIPNKFSFLTGYETIVDLIEDKDAFDLVISLDCSDLRRMGQIYDAPAFANLPLLNIDHHVTNLYFGDVNLVDVEAASTTQVILALLDHLGISLDQKDQDVAVCLLTGIVTDTACFRTSNVTVEVMRAVMRLIETGVSLSYVTHHAFNQQPVAELKLLAFGLGRMQVENGLAWSAITLADREASGYQSDGGVGLAGMLARTQEIQVAAVFSEKPDHQVEVSLRAAPGYDVSQVALDLGGGGHPAASGFSTDGSLEEAQACVLPLLRAVLAQQRGSM